MRKQAEEYFLSIFNAETYGKNFNAETSRKIFFEHILCGNIRKSEFDYDYAALLLLATLVVLKQFVYTALLLLASLVVLKLWDYADFLASQATLQNR